MPAIINFKICDNSEDCLGLDVCKTGAIFWDPKKETLAIDNSKCSNYGQCDGVCDVGALCYAKDDHELKTIQEEIEQDKRNVSDLFIDRFGAMPIHPGFILAPEKFEVVILKSKKLAVVKYFKNQTVQCLLNSIPIKVLLKGMDVVYRKLDAEGVQTHYGIKKFPALVFLRMEL